MALVDEDRDDGFSFIWTIQNFSYCVQKTKEYLRSPCFTVNNENNSETFSLELYPRGRVNNDKVDICVRREFKTSRLRVTYVLSVLRVGGSSAKLSFNIENIFANISGEHSSFSQQEILKKGADSYLDNDTLIIRCRIIKIDDTILESEQSYARTIINVERATWNVKNLSELKANKFETTKPINMSEITSFNVNISIKEMLNEDKFVMTIKRSNTNKLYYSTCTIYLLDTGKVLHSVQNEHFFEKSDGEQIWTVSFAHKPSFLTNSKQNSTIYLRCEFAVSSGEEYSKIEKSVYGSIVDRPLMIPKSAKDSDILGSWKDNLRCFYSEGKISDFTIRTPRKEFPVHKAMLCAQSPVFCAMFERDMKENRTGTVEIEDLEDDTISTMLLFVYTSSVDNLDWEMASKLYFAADKYEMTALKEKCSIYLIENLSTSNACQCLILADTHQDQDLKSVAQDFVVEHSNEIISSDEWKELMKEKSNLAGEMMHAMLMKNFKV